MGEHEPRAFDPRQHVIPLPGRGRDRAPQEYLPIAARIAWFRAEWPDGIIETEHVVIDERIAVFRARVVKATAEGTIHGSATGYGSETPGDFKDFIEKASSKAIGRALAALGYGTAALADDDGPGHPADAPVERPARREPEPEPDDGTPIDQRTMAALHATAHDRGFDHAAVSAVAQASYGVTSTTLLTDDEGRRLRDALARLSPTEANFLGRMLAAPDLKGLTDLVGPMKDARVKRAGLLADVYSRRARAFNAAS